MLAQKLSAQQPPICCLSFIHCQYGMRGLLKHLVMVRHKRLPRQQDIYQNYAVVNSMLQQIVNCNILLRHGDTTLSRTCGLLQCDRKDVKDTIAQHSKQACTRKEEAYPFGNKAPEEGAQEQRAGGIDL